MRTLIVGVALAAVVGGCSGPDANICSAVPHVEDGLGALEDHAKNMQDPTWLERRAAQCVHRWGYRLAKSDDDSLIVAKAVMQACEGAVNDHARAQEKIVLDFHRENSAPSVELMELGERTRNEKLAQMEREAHFRIQQARAGNCKAPA